MIDRRVAILRFWLWCIVALALMVWRPEPLWVVVPLFFTGQAGCFCCTGNCATCAKQQFQLDISDVVNNGCTGCVNYNGTFVVEARSVTSCSDSPGAECWWDYEDASTIPCLSVAGIFVELTMNTTPPLSTGTVALNSNYGSCTYFLSFRKTSAPSDCTTWSAVSHTPFVNNLPGCGFGASAVCLVTAL